MGDWEHGLFECMGGGMGTCCFAFLCTCCAFAKARTDYDDSNLCFNLCCATPPMVQSIIREGSEIDGTCIGDIIGTCLCGPCAAARCLNQAQINKEQRMSR